MEKFKNIKSIPAYLPLMNIDTDKIIPKQFLKTIKRSGLGKSLFYEMRYDEEGNSIKGFVLDLDPYKNSKILLGFSFACDFDVKLLNISVENYRFCDFGGCPELGIRFTMPTLECG